MLCNQITINKTRIRLFFRLEWKKNCVTLSKTYINTMVMTADDWNGCTTVIKSMLLAWVCFLVYTKQQQQPKKQSIRKEEKKKKPLGTAYFIRIQMSDAVFSCFDYIAFWCNWIRFVCIKERTAKKNQRDRFVWINYISIRFIANEKIF